MKSQIGISIQPEKLVIVHLKNPGFEIYSLPANELCEDNSSVFCQDYLEQNKSQVAEFISKNTPEVDQVLLFGPDDLKNNLQTIINTSKVEVLNSPELNESEMVLFVNQYYQA